MTLDQALAMIATQAAQIDQQAETFKAQCNRISVLTTQIEGMAAKIDRLERRIRKSEADSKSWLDEIFGTKNGKGEG